jgi:KRAB domain-containing zinc finger protein
MVKERKHACVHCAATFSSPSKRDRHLRALHPPGAPSFECSLCSANGAKVTFGKASAGLRGFAAHVRTQHIGQPGAQEALIEWCGYTCKLCSSEKPYTCKSFSDMQVHQRVHTKKRGYSCSQCNAAFSRSDNLTCHINAVHLKEKDHECHYCEAAFSTAQNLMTHERTVHDQRRDHACPQCDVAFGEVGTLRRHVRTVHEQRRDHACPQCAAAFGATSDLRRHVRLVHEQRKDHACPQCDAAFGQAAHLRAHVRTVHEQRRDHACAQCDAAFGQASTLRKHVRTVHKQAPLVPPPIPPPVPPPMPPPMPPQQLGGAALLNLVQPGKGNNITLTIASF